MRNKNIIYNDTEVFYSHRISEIYKKNLQLIPEMTAIKKWKQNICSLNVYCLGVKFVFLFQRSALFDYNSDAYNKRVIYSS
jgi:hypothetical protein